MLCENIIGSIKEDKFKDYKIDYVDIEWHDAFKKIHKKMTRNNVEIGIKFEDFILKRGLNDGDVLGVYDDTAIVVNILEALSLVINVEDHHMIPKVCYEIGNRHATLLYGRGHNEFIAIYDEPMKLMIENLGVKVEVRKVKLDFNKKISASINNHHH